MSDFDELDHDVEDEQDDVEHTDDLPDDTPDDTTDNQDTPQDDPADELGFSFDDAEKESSDPYAGQEAPEWVKQVRKENRELKKQLKQLQVQSPQPVLREKPTLAQFDYDETAYEEQLAAWYSEKAQFDEAVKAEQQKYQQYDERYIGSVNQMRTKAADYDAVEDVIVDTLSAQKQAMLKMMVDDPAKMVYALGKSPNKLAQLSQLDDVQFVKQIILMEQQMATKARNPNKPQPKQHQLTGAAGGGDAKLAKLEADAEKTGDRSKVMAYKKSLKRSN